MKKKKEIEKIKEIEKLKYEVNRLLDRVRFAERLVDIWRNKALDLSSDNIALKAENKRLNSRKHELEGRFARAFVDKEVAKSAILKWGAESRIDITIEEMAELIQALMKLKRADGIASQKLDNVYEEFADVVLCLEHLFYTFDTDAIIDWFIKKQDRLKERLKQIE